MTEITIPMTGTTILIAGAVFALISLALFRLCLPALNRLSRKTDQAIDRFLDAYAGRIFLAVIAVAMIAFTAAFGLWGILALVLGCWLALGVIYCWIYLSSAAPSRD
jgi:hypothetical protein